MSRLILGIGAPILDHIVQVDESFIREIEGAKGGMEFISLATFNQLLKKTGKAPIFIAGGSSTNTIKGLAEFGHQCSITGKLADDESGRQLLSTLEKLGVTPLYLKSETATGLSLCLITPDNERTLRTFSGAALEMTGADLKESWFDGKDLIHIEGYTLVNDGLTSRAMELAKKAGAKVSFDLSSFEITARYKKEITFHLANHVDILFANRQEAETFTGLSDPEQAVSHLAKICSIAVVFMGDRGGYVAKGSEKIHYPAFKTNPLDSTGAGDLFASGFLHGILSGHTLEQAAWLGARTASAVVGVYGAEIPKEKWSAVKKIVNN